MRARRIIGLAALGLALGAVLASRRPAQRGGELPPRARTTGPAFIGLGQGGMRFTPYSPHEPDRCGLAPQGWECTRSMGHLPPCALWPTRPPHGYTETSPGVWTDPTSDYEWRPFPPHYL